MTRGKSKMETKHGGGRCHGSAINPTMPSLPAEVWPQPARDMPHSSTSRKGGQTRFGVSGIGHDVGMCDLQSVPL